MKTIPILVGFIILLTGSFSFADAEIIASQVTATTTINNCPNNICQQGLGSGFSALVSSVEFRASNNVGVDQIAEGGIWEFSNDTATATSTTCGSTAAFVGLGAPSLANAKATSTNLITWGNAPAQDQDFLFSSVQLLPECYYWVGFLRLSGGGLLLHGITDPTGYPNGVLAGGGAMKAAYFVVEGVSNDFQTTSRILEQVSPSNGATSPGAAVDFEYTWRNTGFEGYDTSQLEINDITSGFQYTPSMEPLLVTGNGDTTFSRLLEENHLHTWRACLVNSELGTRTCSGYFSLNVVGASASSSFPVIPSVDGDNATTSAQGGIFAFLNVPQLLQSKYPFSWFFDIAELYQQLQASSTEDVATVSLDYSTLDISTTTKNVLPSTWTVFGTSTITAFIPEPVLDAWRLLMTAVIWMSVVAYLYRSISKLFGGHNELV